MVRKILKVSEDFVGIFEKMKEKRTGFIIHVYHRVNAARVSL